MKKLEKDSYLSYGLMSEEEKISPFMKIIIITFPFITFIGSYIKIFGINISNIYSVVLLILFLFNIKEVKKVAPYLLYFFAMIMYAFASLTWSNYSEMGLSILFPLITGFFAMAFIASLKESELQLLLKTLAFYTVVVLIISLIEIYTGKYIIFENSDFIDITNKYNLHYPGFAYANPNDLAQYLLIGSPLLILGLWETKRSILKAILILILTIFVVINTSSRLTLIAFVIIFAYYIVHTFWRKGINLKSILFIIFFSSTLLIILLFSNLNLSLNNVYDAFLKVDKSESYFTGREVLYLNVFELASNNIFFGAGLGSSYVTSIIGPHNMFLFILADLGIFFASSFIIVLVSAFITLNRYKYMKICGVFLGRILNSLLIIFPIFLSISSGNEQRKIIWISMGIVFATINIYRKHLIHNSQEHKKGDVT